MTWAASEAGHQQPAVPQESCSCGQRRRAGCGAWAAKGQTGLRGMSAAGWQAARSAMVRVRSAWERTSVRLALLLPLLLLVAVLAVAWPWLLPPLVWTRRVTHYAQVPAEADPVTYALPKGSSLALPIPAIIHQTWKTQDVPEEWRAAQQSCRDLHPDWEYILWTDANSRTFIEQHYPTLLPTFDAYPFAIQRADAIRYAILHHHGGAYIDLDIVCRRRLDFLRMNQVVLPKTWPVGFSNDFLMAAPGNAFLERLVVSMPAWNLWLLSKYPTVMFSTGPMFVTLKATFYRLKSSLAILPDDLYGKYMPDAPNPLFEHLHGSSWHGEDAKSVLWFLHHPAMLCMMFALAAVSAATAAVRMRMRAVQAVLADSDQPDKMC